QISAPHRIRRQPAQDGQREDPAQRTARRRIQESGRMTASLVRGDRSLPLIETTIGECFDRTAARDPDGMALIVGHQSVRWTWRELKARVDAVAAGLLQRGLKPGDRIGIWAPNCAEWVVVQFATAK